MDTLKDYSCRSPSDVGSHNPLHLGPSVSAVTPLPNPPSIWGSASSARCVLFFSPTKVGLICHSPAKSTFHSRPSVLRLVCSVLFPNWCGIYQSTPFRTQCSRYHSFISPIDVRPLPNPPPSRPNVLRPVSGFYTICNGPGSRLADIVLFGLFLLSFVSKFLKPVC